MNGFSYVRSNMTKGEKRDHRPHVRERRGGKWREEEKKGDHERLRV